MGSVEAPLSLNGGCIADNAVPHYLRPSAGSCHDICKYGRRRSSDDSSADAKKATKPSHDAKSFTSRPKNRSNSPSMTRCTSSESVKRVGGVSLPAKAQVLVKEANNSSGKRPCQQPMKPSAYVRPKQVMVSWESSRGVYGKRRRYDDVLTGRNRGPSMPSAKKAWVPVGAPQGRKTAGVELKDRRKVKRVKTESSIPLESIPALPSSSSPFQEEEDDDQDIMCSDTGNASHLEENEIKIPSVEVEKNVSESESESESSIPDAPSTSSLEEADELFSDKTISQRKINHCKKQRRSRVVVRPGEKRCRPARMKFRMGNQMQQHKEDNSPTRHKLRRTRSKEDVSDCRSSVRIGSLKASRNRDQHGSKPRKNSSRRVRYVKTRVLVLDNMRRKYEKEEAAAAMLLARRNNLKCQRQLQRRKDVQFLFSYVVEETLSKLAERRKGMVKSLIGAYESLMTLQTRSCLLRVAT